MPNGACRPQRQTPRQTERTCLAKRIIACLDVRANDQGDLVVTKGDQYDVREAGSVRNLGKPVQLAGRYFEEGADEVTFLNITGFRDFPLADMPMIQVLKETSKTVFVPLTIGGASATSLIKTVAPIRRSRWRPNISDPGRTRCPSAVTRSISWRII